jgi:RimJ/RimL family protein N-acetyltransferase
MLTGEKVLLRARTADDMSILHDELGNDVATSMRADGGPWVPRSASAIEARHKVAEEGEPDPSRVDFAVQEIASGELAGEAQLWGIDTHNRYAHLGFSLRPSFRGRGLGTDLIQVLCDYGFRVRGLHRLQIETLSDNEPVLRAAAANGFAVEGRLREAGWVGYFADEVILGLLTADWPAHQT